MLDVYKKQKGDWSAYEREFLALMRDRSIEDKLDKESFARKTVLLCSEPTAEHCHRRLVLEYLQERWGDVRVIHL
jgi:uncharacterized protein (DUF488 family)